MIRYPKQDWDPQSEAVQCNQRAAYDQMREYCPVAFSDFFQWSVFRHADVCRILLDPQTFSSRVSQHVSVPNGMDPPQHTFYRKLIDPYFNADRMATFRWQCQAIADELVNRLSGRCKIDLMAELARPFASRVQCAFMGWPLELQPALLHWVKNNNSAVLAGNRRALSALAAEFEDIVGSQLNIRVHVKTGSDTDVTSRLLQEQINGRLLNNQEIAGILRNWTVGEVGTIAASVGILAHFLAGHPDIQQQLREKPELLWQANDEILRMHNPLVDSRRFNTRTVELGGRKIPAGQRVTINWIAANRDPEAFHDPDKFSLERATTKNLLYGAGIHQCPGKPLARMELVVIMQNLLQQITQLRLIAGQPAVFARYPASGFFSLPLKLN